ADDPIENLRYTIWIAYLLLVRDDVAEQRHLLEFLEPPLADGPVRRLRRDEQHRGMIPISSLDRGHESRHTRAILRDRHGELAGRAGIPIADESTVGLMRNIPEPDARFRKEIRDRHERRANNAKRILDSVQLQHLHEGFFGGHLHCSFPRQSVRRFEPKTLTRARSSVPVM